jgi:hypothetical protein
MQPNRQAICLKQPRRTVRSRIIVHAAGLIIVHAGLIKVAGPDEGGKIDNAKCKADNDRLSEALILSCPILSYRVPFYPTRPTDCYYHR